MNHYSNNTAAITSLTTTYCVTQSHFVGANYIPFTQQPVKTAQLIKNSTPVVEPTSVELAENSRLNTVAEKTPEAEKPVAAKRNLTANIAAIVRATHGKYSVDEIATLSLATMADTPEEAQQLSYQLKSAPSCPVQNQSKWSNANHLLNNAVPPNYLINGLLETDSHGILSGASMAFKTFAALRLVHSVCTGNDFFGHPVFSTGKVLYICGEGKGALARRMKALAMTDGDFKDNLFVFNESMRIDNAVDMAELREAIETFNPALVVFDTFASLVSNTDENSPSDVGKALRLIKETCRNGKTSSLIIHHHGKDASKGSRGASNFTNDVDFAFEMNRANDSMLTTLSCKKMKDGGCFADVHMLAQVVDLGLINQDGTATTSLVLKPTESAPAKKERLTERQQAVLHELHNALDKFGIEPPPEVKAQFADCPMRLPKKVVPSEKWRELAYKIIAVDSDSKDIAQAKRKSFSRCAELLKAAKKINFYDGYYWAI
jgi:hypothetical protein